jgi:signal peptidase I
MARQVVEFFVCLAVAVILFKAFLIEGYVITTGSMAPTLLGFHKQVRCPSCHCEFALGIPAKGQTPSRAVCPNCDAAGIPTESLFANDGDQILVHKTAFQFRWPRRWEVSVFRNPNQITEAYVKRIIGLPGEQIQIRRGDVFVNGEIARKGLTTQRGIRILVHDHALKPAVEDAEDWQPRWLGDQPWWQPRGAGFAVDTRPEKDRPAQTAWLTYRHWIRSGGRQVTRQKLAAWPAGQSPPTNSTESLFYDRSAHEVVCRGALSEVARNRLLKSASDKRFQEAIEQLYGESHIAPITDFYAYNRQQPGNGDSAIVRDLMLAATVDFKAGQGEFQVEMNDGADTYRWVFDLRQQQMRLHRVGIEAPVRTAPLPPRFTQDKVLLEMSLFDRQVLCAVDGRVLFDPWELPPTAPSKNGARRQVRLGARGVRLHVLELKLYRDVYYTADGGREAKIWELENSAGRQEFFVLGDNSPISLDSRLWQPDVVVTPQLLIGKPFMVHLPVRTTEVKVGTWHGRLRVPDFSRIRYIR